MLVRHVMFDTAFLRGRDTEIGYRLCAEGLRLNYLEAAVGWHFKKLTTEDFMLQRREYGFWYKRMLEKHPRMPIMKFERFNFPAIESCRKFVEEAESLYRRGDDDLLGSQGLRDMLFAGYRMLAAFEVCQGMIEDRS